MKAIWQMWAQALNQESINNIITKCELYDPVEASTGFNLGIKEKAVRSSTVRWINKNDKDSKFIHDLIYHYAAEANRNAFGVDISYLSDIQYTIYDAKEAGHYGWHFDTFWDNDTTTNDRKLSVTIQLSDGNKDYEGGEFELDQQYEQPNQEDLRSLGTVLVFPSPIRHRVKPVTKGIRKSLVAWVEGPKWR